MTLRVTLASKDSSEEIRMPGDDEARELSTPAQTLVTLARGELGAMSTRRRAEGFLKLDAKRSSRSQRAPRALSVALVLAVIAFAAGAGRWLALQHGGALSYAVEGGSVDASGALQATRAADATLRFSDGTEIVFLPGARGRVKSVGEHDARIELSGKVDVAVVPRPGSYWLFDAGPFLITVTGTAFTAEWRDAEERLEVTLKAGTVHVTGPLSSEAIALRAGQRLVASVREKQVVVRSIDSAPDAGVAGSPRPEPRADNVDRSPRPLPEAPPPATQVHPSAGAAATSVGSAPRPVASSWAEELAAGRFSTILRQAEERGISAVIAEVSSSELAILADAARYSRREDVARLALTAQGRRFPGSARASDAAFLLGRLEETGQRLDLALGWYERCLSEASSGTYTSEALGRKMTVVRRLHGAGHARPIAEEYLRRFGNGTYAAAARAVIHAE